MHAVPAEGPHPSELADCVNSAQSAGRFPATNWESAMSDVNLAGVTIGGVWWSSKERNGVDVPLTMVTQVYRVRLHLILNDT